MKLNGKYTLKFRSGSIGFKNCSKQLAVPFKIHADSESVLKEPRGNDRNNNTSYTEKYQSYIPCIFAYKVVCFDDKLGNQLFFTEQKRN